MPIYKKLEDGMYYKNNYSEIFWESVDELIDRATPKEVIMIQDDAGFADYHAVCPNCLITWYNETRFCPHCGQALKIKGVK